jgi:outer membrane protein
VKAGWLKIFGIGCLLFAAVGSSAQTDPARIEVVSVVSPPPNSRTNIDGVQPLTLAEAIDLALKQASNFRSAQINEQIASEDIRQAQAAFLPKIESKPNYIYTSPSLGSTHPRPPSFLGANAINEIQGLIVASGEIDVSGKLNATLRRKRALLASAHAGTEVARRDLIQAVSDAYFNLALATAKRRAAENNLAAAAEFENNTKLQLDAGEVAPVDYTRARLQTASRRDELEQARADESVNADGLRVFTGTSFGDGIAAVDLLTEMPVAGDVERFAEVMIATRPEFAQFEAERKAAAEEIRIAKADRRPQMIYSTGTGFISDSLVPAHLRDSMGVQLNVGVTIPIFDWGAARSRETQAGLRVQLADNARALAERQFAQAFFTARTQAIAARTRITQIAASIIDAENNVSASTARYRAGEASILEVTEAQNTLVTQKTALYQAIFDYQTARSRLMRAAGQ